MQCIWCPRNTQKCFIGCIVYTLGRVLVLSSTLGVYNSSAKTAKLRLVLFINSENWLEEQG